MSAHHDEGRAGGPLERAQELGVARKDLARDVRAAQVVGATAGNTTGAVKLLIMKFQWQPTLKWKEKSIVAFGVVMNVSWLQIFSKYKTFK